VILQYKKTENRPENSNNPITEKKLLSSRILEQINARCLKPIKTGLVDKVKTDGKEESKDNSVSMLKVSYPLPSKSKTTKNKTSFVA
jgi:hypothetical protein